ncbi:MAG: PhnD/SsuA/transferrin family substrate-binding protein [Leptolyngbyaceae bacterium]|nr:PhnD/SsuA/transferrin family substrate-binding protein [Leptolyngbyaceae bacterium]
MGSTLLGGLLLINACQPDPPLPVERLTVGVVTYHEGEQTLERYERFIQYLSQQTQTIVELEPVYNELQALERIQQQSWSIVFAPASLAAIAIDQSQYAPLLPLDNQGTLYSLIVVRQDSNLSELSSLQNTVLALGEKGSAAGYYFPLYDLYGLTFAEIRFAPTPKTALEWLSQGTVDAAALAEDQYDTHRSAITQTPLTILHRSRPIPNGVVLLGPTIDRNQEELIRKVFQQATSDLTNDVGYLPNGTLPDYSHLLELIEKVQPLETRLQDTPAILTKE